MKNLTSALILSGILFLFYSSCKKDLDSELNYNVFDADYVGPEPVTVDEFIPIYSTVHQRNILRIKIKYNKPVKGARAYLYKNGTFFAAVFSDTSTILTDYYILAGQTCSYQSLFKYKNASTALSEAKSFTMY